MSSLNDGNNALVAYNGSALPAEQNDMRAFLDYIKNDVNSDIEHTDEELRNSIIQLLNIAFPVLIETQEYDMLGILVQSMLEDEITIEEKKLIVCKLFSFARDNQWMQFWDFFYEAILPKTSIYGIIKDSLESRLHIREKIVEAQAMSQIRINESEYYSHLRINEEWKRSQMRINEEWKRSQMRINEEAERSQMRINEEAERSQMRINEEAERSQMRTNEYCQKAKIDAEIKLWFREEKHKQDLEFAADAKKRKEEESHAQTTMVPEIVAVDYLELEESFIKEKHLVRVMRDGELKIYRWDEGTNRYVSFVTKSTIITALGMYAHEKYGKQIELSSKKLDDVVNRMLYASVPLLNESETIKISMDTQVFFKDGYLDIKIDSNSYSCFYTVDTKDYFHVFCLPYIFEQGLFCPLAFDELLNYMFDDDKTKITLVYEIIGAILSDVPLKNVFVFQGISNGGKSTLAKIIMRLFNEDEVKQIGSINEIDEIKSKKYEGKIKLLYIDDAPNERWSSQTVSYLKTRSSGIQRGLTSTFKILLSTNYPIMFKTEDGRDESMEGRIVVVPFKKNLKTVEKENASIGEIIRKFRDGSLNYELPYIAKEALIKFGNVYKRNQEFVHHYQLNKCVVNSGTEQSNNDGNTSNESKSKNSPTFFNAPQKISDKNEKLLELLRENFERTDKEEEYLMADTVLKIIEELMPGTNGSVQNVGKTVKAVFGDDCSWNRRKDNKTWYKIKRKL